MGNSNGCLKEYFEAFETYHGLQGGFIWEYFDHGIPVQDGRGNRYYAYGGDFGDAPNDANFCCDGLVWPNGTPKPAMQEFKKLAQPLRVKTVDAELGRYRVVSKQDFISLSWLTGVWTVEVDGVAVGEGDLPELNIGPGDGMEFEISLPDMPLGQEAFVIFRFFACRETCGIPEGHEVAWEQLPLRVSKPSLAVEERGLTWEVKKGDARLVELSREDVCIEFNRDAAELSCLSVRGKSVLSAGPRLQIWRAPTDNDGIRLRSGQEGKPLARWQCAGLDRLKQSETSLASQPDRPEVTLRQVWSTPAFQEAFIHTQVFDFDPCGLLRVRNEVVVHPEITDLPRVGVVWRLKPGFENLEWFGLGPHESYSDRKESARVGRFSGTVHGQYVPYIMPQEHGNRSEVRWVSLSDGNSMFRVIAGEGELFQFSASHYTAEDISEATHTHELHARPETFLYIDYRQRGLGTASCGPDTLMQYRLMKRRYEFTYALAMDAV
jgi:beta-galactosidase